MSETNLFAAMLGPEPTWEACACGAMVSQAPCWDCDMDGLRKRDRGELSGVPRGYLWATPDAPELVERVRLHPDHIARGMTVLGALERLRGASRALLIGPAQRGKTSLAVAALRARRAEAFFVRAETLGLARQQARLGTGEAKLVDRASSTGLLLLDDLGSEGDHEARIQAVRDVLFGRYEDRAATWVTTGLGSAQLERRYGAGILARLKSSVTIHMAPLGAEAAQ